MKKQTRLAVHTVPDSQNHQWNNIDTATKSVLSSSKTKEEAVKKGREFAIERKTEHVIHKKNGQIQDKNSYGNDPSNIKG